MNMPRFMAARRRWLAQAGALASSLALPLCMRRAGAQPQPALSALPRVALVIGNSRYPAAQLKTPGNDARDIAGELQKLGFVVNLVLDAGRDAMLEAIRAFGAELAAKKAVGMFYYAGHGAQLAWKNYLVPVDAQVERIEELPAKTVELKTLLEAIAGARNPMNVVVLDACRDNPFGARAQAAQKGLSQFDAPPNSLLAYATLPGNTTAEGNLTNGLYAGSLLRELKVADATIEDVFKRVRLSVRRASEGRQIPWESTSLEADFYFLPPARAGRLSDAEREKAFNEELAGWERIRQARETAPLVAFLEKYPGGHFAELAQFQLDRLLAQQGEQRVEAESAADNPFTKGTARADTNFRVGDSYTLRWIDALTKVERRTFTDRITAVTDTEVIINNGRKVTDLLGNVIKSGDGRTWVGRQEYVPEYSLGKRWTSKYTGSSTPGGGHESVEIAFKVVAREKIDVPAGSFDAFKVYGEGYWTSGIRSQFTYWIAPDRVRRPLVLEILSRMRSTYTVTDRFELVSFRQSG